MFLKKIYIKFLFLKIYLTIKKKNIKKNPFKKKYLELKKNSKKKKKN